MVQFARLRAVGGRIRGYACVRARVVSASYEAVTSRVCVHALLGLAFAGDTVTYTAANFTSVLGDKVMDRQTKHQPAALAKCLLGDFSH